MSMFKKSQKISASVDILDADIARNKLTAGAIKQRVELALANDIAKQIVKKMQIKKAKADGKTVFSAEISFK